MNSCIYLRKSRADEALEKIENGNTLLRHKEILLDLSEKMELNVTKIYEEIVSGEKLSKRPEMIKLLNDVSNKKYSNVLVMDIDRLGRGNMQEQGIILETFKQSSTKIITPSKVYDLNNEFDEEYSEFEAFMARRELKIITKRMQRGRKKSVADGNYIYTYAPYGYIIKGSGKTRKLVLNKEAAGAVKMIFSMYLNGYGGTKIAEKLNSLGFKTSRGNMFTSNSILSILKNPIYTGELTWQKNGCNQKKLKDEKPNEFLMFKGKHEKIISKEIYTKAMEKLKTKSHPSSPKKLRNPLAGLIFCGSCGSIMKYRSYQNSNAHLICTNPDCKKNKSTRFDYIEDKILYELENILLNYNSNIPIVNSKSHITNTVLNKLKREKKEIEIQINKTYELLEKEIYTEETFIKRKKTLEKNLKQINEYIKNAEDEFQMSANKKIIIPKVKTALDIYKISNNNELKNQMLKNIISKIIYVKNKECKSTEFHLDIYLKI